MNHQLLRCKFCIINTGDGGSDFGDATTGRRAPAGAGNRTRALSAGGCTPTVQDNIDFFTFASTGNGQDFGNMSTGGRSWVVWVVKLVHYSVVDILQVSLIP